MAIAANLNESTTPSGWKAVYKNNISASVYSTSPSSSSEQFRNTSYNEKTLLTTTVTFRKTAAPKGLLRHAVWFGLKRQHGKWKWTDGSQLSYTNWAPGEPGKNFIGRTAGCANVYSKLPKEEHLLIEETGNENSVGPTEE
ncbi:Hypp7382 [Branchiostoma lanceolatum]|uniref:Hypp7382 protein n=1 Tax=Branchiostoma lanceolatum TaxID=7740 RepID=A0A8K0EDQ5_BRALA|nr:Hypp7382 [Branchiostoma lanceolatum]